jgi:hypothetical protein
MPPRSSLLSREARLSNSLIVLVAIGDPDTFQLASAEMARSQVDAIVTSTQPALQATAGTGAPIIISANNCDIAHGYVKAWRNQAAMLPASVCDRPNWPKRRLSC